MANKDSTYLYSAIGIIFILIFAFYILPNLNQYKSIMNLRSPDYQSKEKDIITNKNIYKTGEIIIKFTKNSNINDQVSATNYIASKLNTEDISVKRIFQQGMNTNNNFFTVGLDRVYKITTEGDAINPKINILKQDTNFVEYAEPNYEVYLSTTPNDPFFSEQWAYQNIGAEGGWSWATGSSNQCSLLTRNCRATKQIVVEEPNCDRNNCAELCSQNCQSNQVCIYNCQGDLTNICVGGTSTQGQTQCTTGYYYGFDNRECQCVCNCEGIGPTYAHEYLNNGIVIAVADSGIDLTHPDLINNLWINQNEQFNGIDDDHNGFIDDINGYNFGSNNSNLQDSGSHGTHVSGIASAVTNNGLGIAGTCWNCKIMVLKFFDPFGYVEDAVRAIQYAADNGARVTSNSYETNVFSNVLQDAINYAYSSGVITIAAAGNSGTNSSTYPAAMQNVVAVAATDQEDHKTSFSNYGNWIDISAPGLNILSTWPVSGGDSYRILHGTSMATPFVSGLAALILSQEPDLRNQDVEKIIKSSADNIDHLNPEYMGLLGSGRLNINKALSYPKNPSFEVDTGIDYYPNWSQEDSVSNNNKPDGYVTSGSGLLDNVIKYQGSKSLKIQVTNNRGYSYQDIIVEYNKKYRVSGYVKTDCSDNNCYGTILSECENINHQPIWDYNNCKLNINPINIRRLYNDNNWTYVEFDVENNRQDAKFLRVLCYNTPGPNPVGSGVVWCDSFNVIEIPRGPVGSPLFLKDVVQRIED